jgi:chromosomal replication initiator protein
LLQAFARAKLANTTPSLNDVRAILTKLGREEEAATQMMGNQFVGTRSVTTGEEVLEKVADYFKVTKSDLVGERRSREVLMPRQLVMYFLRQELDYSFERIGDLLGGRNHTTAMHAYNKVLDALKTDKKLVRDIGVLRREMGF